MRKIALVFAFLFAAGIAFADRARFYEKGKVIDTMFVDATDGLRVREEPSLTGKKICALQHRMPVKDTVEFHTEYVMEFEDEYSWELKLVFESDGSFHFDAGESVNYCYPSFAQDNASVYSTTRHGNFIDWLADVKYWSPYDTPIEERVMELIEWGISAEGTKFEQMYHEYWNPIMAEHQKKADSGK